MDQSDLPHTVIIRPNGSGDEDSIRYEITPSGLLAKIYTHNAQTHMELITHVPGLSNARHVYTQASSQHSPPLDIEVNGNGIQSISQLPAYRTLEGTPTPDPETPANNIAAQPSTMPGAPCALRQAGPSTVLNRTFSIGTPSPDYGGPAPGHLLREETPGPSREMAFLRVGHGNHNSASPFSLFRHQQLAPMPSFPKEASPVPTEIVNPESDNEYDDPAHRRTVQPGINNGYGLFIARNRAFGSDAIASTAKTHNQSPFSHSSDHRERDDEQESCADDTILVSHLLGQRDAAPAPRNKRAQISPNGSLVSSNGLLSPNASPQKLNAPERITRAKARMLASPIKRSARLAARHRF